MYSAGFRETNPSDRLIDRLQKSGNITMSSTTSSTTNLGTGVPISTTQCPSDSNKQTDVSLSDLFVFMIEVKEKNKQRLDKIDKYMSSFVHCEDAVEARATKIEKAYQHFTGHIKIKRPPFPSLLKN